MEKSAEKLAIPKPKNGLFDSYEDIKLYYNHHKAKYPKDEHIPIVLSHVKREKEWQLYKADPKQKINFVLSTIIRKIGQKEKLAGREFHQNDTVNIFYKKSNKLATFSEDETVQEKYDKLKDEDGYLCMFYQFSDQFCQSGITGLELAVILPVILLAMPILASVMAFDWTSKTLRKIEMPSLPSLPSLPTVRLPAFRSKMHKFDYKVKFPFEYRREQFMNFQARFNDQIQIILERHQSSHLPQLPFFKFAAKKDLVYRHFCGMLQKRISTAMGDTQESKHSLFFVIGSQIPNNQMLMQDIYKRYQDQDGLLYVVYQQQESF